MTCLFGKGEGSAHLRWLLLGSIGLNLAFMGAAGAVAFRYSSPVPLRTVARIDHSLAGRLDRIAASLPAADAQVMHAQLRQDAETVAAAQADLRLSQEAVRKNFACAAVRCRRRCAPPWPTTGGAAKFR